MDVVVAILVILMSMIVGYLLNEWIRANKKKRTIKRASNKEFYKDYLIQLVKMWFKPEEAKKIASAIKDIPISDYDTHFQGPPRKSAMRFITLEDLLKRAIEEENYENAAKLRDAIKKQNNNKSNEVQ